MSSRAARALRRFALATLPVGLLACASLIGLEDGELAATAGSGGAAGATGGAGGNGGSGGVAGGGSGGVAGSGGTSGSGGVAGSGGGTGATGGAGTGGTGATGGGGTGGTGATGGGGTGGTGATGGTGPTGGTGGVTGSKYANAVLADAPIAYWRLDEPAGSTSVADSSGNGHTGTATNSKLAFGKPGVSNTAVQFDGTGQLDFGDKFSFDGTTPMSVEGWFWPIGNGCGFVGKGDWTTAYDGWFLAEGVGVLQAVRGSAVQTTPKLDQTQFTHVVMTYDGTTHALYVNGALVKSSASLTTVNKHTHSFTIGGVYQWKTFTGWIDEVALYDKALSAAAVAAHFNAAK